jgi:hypothetical protein
MSAVRKLTLYLDRANKQWIVRDHEGNFWSIPSEQNAWEQRQRFFPTEETELEPIPAHYKYTLGLPD